MIVEKLLQKRKSNPSKPGIKVNIYRDYEYRALVHAICDRRIDSVETVMVGDSYFMTHLGRSSTRLGKEDTLFAIEELPRLIREVRGEIDRDPSGIERPLLMADVPDGLDEQQMADIIGGFRAAGADIVKLEVILEADLWPLPLIHAQGMLSAVHLGYSPQKNENMVYGQTAADIQAFLALLERVRREGAELVIFERMAELANVVLTRYSIQLGMLPYSIFSGRAPLGGQSLNIWDAVVRHERESAFFPPTACIDRADVTQGYTEDVIRACIGKLLALTDANVFPPSPRNRMAIDECLNILEKCA